MKKLFVIALAAMSMVACVNENITEIPNGGAISFENAFIDNATRAAVDPSFDNDNLTSFNVWGYVENTTGTVFTGTEVKNNNGVYTYEGTQYWAPEKNYYFAAVAGVAAENVTATDSVKPTDIAFTNEAGTQDLIYAYEEVKSLGAGQDNPAVELVFNHLLSKVKFSFTNGFPTSNVKVAVKDITMTAVEKATYNIESNAWKSHNGNVTLAFGNNDGDYVATTATESANERLIIPTDGEQEYNIAFTIKVYQGDVEVNSVEKTSTISGVAFEQGKAYNLTAEITPETLGMDEIEFTVVVNDWEEPTIEEEIGFSYNEATNTYVVNNAEGLKLVIEEMNADANIVLNGDIDLAELAAQTRSAVASNWTPIGTPDAPFTGTLDGKGCTIKNLTIIENEAKEDKAYIGFFGYAKGTAKEPVVIKNVNFENVNINIPCLDIDHSQGHIGAVAGSLEGTALIENVTVKGDIFVEATVEANGASRVAVVAGGNSDGDVTMRNVHVIANEGSYLKANNNVGALAGQLQVKNYFENCSSNIDVTGTKFYAGGIIGLAAGNSTFINCHTTGDITVTAGREGRHNDEYRVGGIAGGWADNVTTPCVLTDCSYTGVISGKNSDGSVAEPLDYWGYVGRGYTLTNRMGSTVTIDGTSFIQRGNTAEYYGVYDIIYAVKTAEEFDAALADENVIEIKLANDIETEGIKKVAAGKTLTLNLNGYTLSTTDNTEKNFSLIDNRGTLTIKGEGKMTTVATINSGWNRYSAVVANNPGGNLTVEGGVVIEHLGGTDMAYGIDNLTNGKGTKAVTTIKDATIKSPYRAVRQFLNGVEAYNELYVEAGAVIEGANKSIWMQDPSKNANTGKLVVKEGAELNGDVLLSVTAGSTEWPVEVSIAASAVNGEVLTGSAPVPAGYAVVLKEGYYVVIDDAILSADALIEALEKGGDVVLGSDIKIDPAGMSNAYGTTGINVKNGQTIDGAGHTLDIKGAGGTWDSGINTTGGLIQNLTVTGSFRGIFINHNSTHSETVVLRKVTIEGTTYTISCDQGMNQNFEAYNSTFKGWTSYAATIGTAKFVDCYFGEGNGYAYCRPYAPTEFVNCDFEAGFGLDARAKVTFENCTIGGVALTAENLATLVTSNTQNASVK